jgi:endonuclease-3
MKPTARHEFFLRLRAANPTPQTELNYGSPFQLLIAVILSAQATDKSVNTVTARLFAAAASPLAMLELGEERLSQHIQSIGLFRSKAKHIVATCKKLQEEFSGQVPRTREELETLPGVGRKTANVVLNTAFGVPTIAVDTHIFRVANRTGLARGKDVLEVELRLLRAVPEAFRKDAHHWLILHGRYVCKARKPDCGQCLVADLCDFPGKASNV